MPPTSALYMASAFANGSPEPDTFHKFFECWMTEQNKDLQDLISASKNYQNHINCSSSSSGSCIDNESSQGVDESVLRSVVDRVIRHYEQYYNAKSRWANEDVLNMLSPSWRSSLEEAFLWIGGWRPSMAFHLLYSKSGLQLEARLADLIRGLSTGDLGDLSPAQLIRIDELQRKTIRKEKRLTEKMAKQQEKVADSSMVELSHIVSEMIRDDEASVDSGGMQDDQIESTLAAKEEGLEEVLHKADELRLRTLTEIIEILTPIQAVHFLIAAAELHLRLHEWGKKKDARKHQVRGETAQPN